MIRRLLVVSAVLLVSAASSSASAQDWDTFSADVTMRHGRVLANGTPGPVSAPESTFRLERSRSAGGWKTVVAVLSIGPIAGSAGGGVNPRGSQAQIGMRIEDPGDGSPIRIVDGLGRAHSLPQGNALSKLLGGSALLPVAWSPTAEDVASGVPRVRPGGETDWIDGLVLKTSQRDARVRALESSRARQPDRAGGLDRYVAVDNGEESEVLVDPSSGLPVETNLVEHGRLVTHATYGYTPYGSDSVVRNSVRLEHTVPGGTGERMFTVMQLTNVRFETRGEK